MHEYYCKKCDRVIGSFDEKYQHQTINRVIYNRSTYSSILFMNCRKCNTFFGLRCCNVCINCYGHKQLLDEEELFKWFKIWKPTISHLFQKFKCKICGDLENTRLQDYVFKNLFTIKKI